MPVAMPRSVREAWGEEATEDFIRWFDQAVQETAVSRDEFHQVLTRLGVLEHDVAEIKRALDELRREMNERFDRMNERFDRMNERFDQMYDRMMVMTRWTIGVIALFGAAVTILLAVAQFAP